MDNRQGKKGVVLSKFGDFSSIKIEDLLVNEAVEERNVEISVTYCGVNFADIYLRKGLIPDLNVPCVLGMECTGVVVKIGNRVTKVKVGERVVCYDWHGGLYKESVNLSEDNCFVLPEFIDDENAVAIPTNYLTAYFCLFESGHLKSGDKILLHSCAGGVGWATTQLANTIDNVTVIGTAAEWKHKIVMENGMKKVLKSECYFDEIRDDKFDIIIDSVGGKNISKSISLLRSFGKLIIIGASELIGTDENTINSSCTEGQEISVLQLFNKNISVSALHLGLLFDENPSRIRQTMNLLFSFYSDGKIKPRIHCILPFDRAVDAMKILAERKNVGKVILKL